MFQIFIPRLFDFRRCLAFLLLHDVECKIVTEMDQDALVYFGIEVEEIKVAESITSFCILNGIIFTCWYRYWIGLIRAHRQRWCCRNFRCLLLWWYRGFCDIAVFRCCIRHEWTETCFGNLFWHNKQRFGCDIFINSKCKNDQYYGNYDPKFK